MSDRELTVMIAYDRASAALAEFEWQVLWQHDARGEDPACRRCCEWMRAALRATESGRVAGEADKLVAVLARWERLTWPRAWPSPGG